MSLSNVFETAFLNLIFTNANTTAIGDATGLRGSSTAGVFYVGLHTADPGEAGSQSTSETTYGSYARQSVVRTTSGWSVSGNIVSNVGSLAFPACSSGSQTITHFSIGTDASGTGALLFKGALTTTLLVNTGVIPTFSAGSLTVSVE